MAPRPAFGSGPVSPPPPRAPFATLTEDDVLDQCARETAPPPMPAADYVREMMKLVEDDAPRASPDPFDELEIEVDVPVSANGVSDEVREVELGELPAGVEADLLEEIGQTYLSRLGGRTHIPFTVMPVEQALAVQLDHWSGFVLSLIDGATTVEQVVDASSLAELEALRVLCELRERGLIDVRPAESRRRTVPRPGRRV